MVKESTDLTGQPLETILSQGIQVMIAADDQHVLADPNRWTLAEAIRKIYDTTRRHGGTTLGFGNWKNAIRSVLCQVCDKPLSAIEKNGLTCSGCLAMVSEAEEDITAGRVHDADAAFRDIESGL